MNFLVGVIIFNTLVLVVCFCFLLVGGAPWHKGTEFEPIKIGKRIYTIERFTVGICISILGISWLAAWIYFMSVGDQSLIKILAEHFLHITFQLAASISMIIAGIAILRQWNRSKGLFISSMGIFVGGTLFAVLFYGPNGHYASQVFMYLVTLWTLVFGGVFTMGLYFYGRFIHNKDQNVIEEEKCTI